MKYLIHKLADKEEPTLLVNGAKFRVEPFEVATHPVLPLRLLRETPPEPIERIHRLLKKSLDVMGDTIYEQASQLMKAKPDAKYIVFLIRQDLTCLCADNPGHNVYDPPAEWDEETEGMVVPLGAEIVDRTEAVVGWSIFTTLGMAAVNSLPEGFSDEHAFEEFPFWTAAPARGDVLAAALQTPNGRHLLAEHYGRCAGFGEKPIAHGGSDSRSIPCPLSVPRPSG